jgi:glutathione S-transferase
MMHHLISIGPSHYCEKARWALDLARLPYTEEFHLPVFHARHAKRAGGKSSTPVLTVGSRSLNDSTDIMRYIHEHPDSAWRPYLDSPALDAQALELEERFDERLGPHVRRVAYWYLLPNKALVCQVMGSSKLPALERCALPYVYPLAAIMLRKGLNIHEGSVARSRVYVAQVFDEVAAQLADGRAHLVSDELSSADVTFAALAAPLLLPERYYWPMPAWDELPAAMRDEASKLREHPAGRYAMRLYETRR